MEAVQAVKTGERREEKEIRADTGVEASYKGSRGMHAWGVPHRRYPVNAKGSPEAWGLLTANTVEEKRSSTIGRSERKQCKEG